MLALEGSWRIYNTRSPHLADLYMYVVSTISRARRCPQRIYLAGASRNLILGSQGYLVPGAFHLSIYVSIHLFMYPIYLPITIKIIKVKVITVKIITIKSIKF